MAQESHRGGSLMARSCPCGASLANRHHLSVYCSKCSRERDKLRLKQRRKDEKVRANG